MITMCLCECVCVFVRCLYTFSLMRFFLLLQRCRRVFKASFVFCCHRERMGEWWATSWGNTLTYSSPSPPANGVCVVVVVVAPLLLLPLPGAVGGFVTFIKSR